MSTEQPNIVCLSCGYGHHRKYQRGESMEPCPHCGSSALRFVMPGEPTPPVASPERPTPDARPDTDELRYLDAADFMDDRDHIGSAIVRKAADWIDAFPDPHRTCLACGWEG